MFKVYDQNMRFLMLLDKVGEVTITEDITKGTKNLQFQVPVKEEYLHNLLEENYIESSDYSYVIKEIVLESNSFYTVYCIANYEELTNKVFKVFDVFEKSLKQAYEYCVSLSNWQVNYQSLNLSQTTLQELNVNGFDMLKVLAEAYHQELWFDTKHKMLYVYDKMGTKYGSYYMNELKLQQLMKQSQTYDFATILYPYGKDGLNIKNINNGKEFLENYTYSNKKVERIWVDTKYEHAEDLKKAGEMYLEELAQPKSSYKLSLASLGNVGLGDEIILIDKIKRIKQKQRVVKITRHPFQPEKDSVEISNLQVDFTKTYLKNQQLIQKDLAYFKSIINNISKV